MHLSAVFDGTTADELTLGAPDLYDTPGVELVLGDASSRIDTAAGTATTASGREIAYRACVIATGSFPFVPPIPGVDAAGSFVYRTLDDLDAIRAWAAGRDDRRRRRRRPARAGGRQRAAPARHPHDGRRVRARG